MAEPLSEIASVRLTAAEKEQLRAEAAEAGVTIAELIRRRTLPAPPPAGGGNPHRRAWTGDGWDVAAAPGRNIQVRGNLSLRRPADAVALARALLCAADIAELPDPAEAVS